MLLAAADGPILCDHEPEHVSETEVSGTEVSGAEVCGECMRKILGGAMSGFLNSLEWNWSDTAQLRSSAAHNMSRPAQVACLHECAQHVFFFFSFLNYN